MKHTKLFPNEKTQAGIPRARARESMWPFDPSTPSLVLGLFNHRPILAESSPTRRSHPGLLIIPNGNGQITNLHAQLSTPGNSVVLQHQLSPTTSSVDIVKAAKSYYPSTSTSFFPPKFLHSSSFSSRLLSIWRPVFG
ncbi:hypothetical protein PGT21_020930 [Puccinia graminis f. sp. tritici]|uniref:Uncharacterized protein n=1 Tax=Puccinia graminis f. sp. tritici TaxID=56615 RepID=A0A5B0RHW3_PUCGR|nr:hypothetical protein PGT21_020930 [Puccinia graminis f. sp. tritici]KAA1125406.1 hypothetical protein PGTUg99_005205 [Puccinia graminis f. sp. tritici]